MGLAVGFLKGGLWLACWIGALFATIYAYPYFEPSLWNWLNEGAIITNKFLGDLAIGAGIFLISLVFLFILSSVVTGWVRSSSGIMAPALPERCCMRGLREWRDTVMPFFYNLIQTFNKFLIN